MTTFLQSSIDFVNTAIAGGNTSATLSDATCMVHGLTSLAAISVFNGHALTLVANGTVGIAEYSAHYPPAIGNTGVFGANTYTIVDIQTLPGTDIGFAKLNAKVTSVSPIKILPATSSKFGGFMAGLPAIWVVVHANRIQVNQVEILNLGPGAGPNTGIELPTDPTWLIGTNLVSGDSDSPMVTIANNDLVLLATATTGSSGTCIAQHHIDAPALWLSAWGITDTYTDADLSAYTNDITGTGGIMATITWTGAGEDSGNPDDADNWDLDRLPLPTDSIVVDMPSTVDFNNDPTTWNVVAGAIVDADGNDFGAGMTINGPATLRDGTYHATINGPAAFNANGINSGIVNGNVTLGDDPEQGQGQNTSPGVVNGTLTTTVNNEAHAQGTITGGVILTNGTEGRTYYDQVAAKALLSLFPITSPVASPVA